MKNVTTLDKENQKEVNERMRVILVDWLTDVSEHFKLTDRTYQLSITYLNRYLSRVPHIPRAKFQLIGVCCLKLADCFNERSREFYRMMTSTEYSHMTANEFSREEVVAMEKEIAKAIDYQFDSCTAIEAINMSLVPKSRAQEEDDTATLDKRVDFLGMYFSDLAQLSSKLTCRYSPSLIAFSSLLLASIELNCPVKFNWPSLY